jgi:hypothetical protein
VLREIPTSAQDDTVEQALLARNTKIRKLLTDRRFAK